MDNAPPRSLDPQPTRKAPHPARPQGQIEYDRARIARIYVRGRTMQEIADTTHLPLDTVKNDIQAIRKAWEKSTLVDFDAARNRELAKIDAMELEYWQSWEDSKKDREVTTTETSESDKVTNRVSIRTEGRDPNAAFLAGVGWCIERRCRLLGLDKAERINVHYTKALIGIDPEEI